MEATMKAIISRRYGGPDAFALSDEPKPEPRSDQVLIRVHASTVTAADCLMRRGSSVMGRIILGITKPRRRYRIPGLELAGVVEAIGESVIRFKPGDRVFGFRGFGTGTCAEYKTMPEKDSLALMPVNLGFAEAASIVDSATTALYFLHDLAGIKRGDRVLINGASGGIGLMAIQLAKHFGAEVTGVASSAKAQLVTSLGADKLIDYASEDFTRNDQVYDIIFDIASASSFRKCRASLAPGGRYLAAKLSLSIIVSMLLNGLWRGRKALFGMSIHKQEALATIKRLVEEGQIKPVIDRIFTLEQTANAHAYLESGQKRGSVVISLEQAEAGSQQA